MQVEEWLLGWVKHVSDTNNWRQYNLRKIIQSDKHFLKTVKMTKLNRNLNLVAQHAQIHQVSHRQLLFNSLQQTSSSRNARGELSFHSLVRHRAEGGGRASRNVLGLAVRAGSTCLHLSSWLPSADSKAAELDLPASSSLTQLWRVWGTAARHNRWQGW